MVETVQKLLGGKLPVPIPRNAWFRLTVARDKIADENEWQIIALECAAVIDGWAEAELSKLPSDRPRIVRVTTNARMIDELQRNPESRDWSRARWAKHLGVSGNAIQKSPAWKEMMRTRAEAMLFRKTKSPRRFED